MVSASGLARFLKILGTEEHMARSAIWKGSISFGLLNIPVTLQTASESKDLHFQMLDSKDLAPIKYKKVNANTGREVAYERIAKGYEYEPDQYVIMTKQDFAAANPKATQTIDIEDFVDLTDIDPLMIERPYYLVPQKGGEKGYFLLRDALEKTEKVAVGKIVIRTKQHLCSVMARGDYLICMLLRFAHEVLEINEVDYLEDVKKVHYSPKELKMAEQLISGMSSKWEPEKYKDTYYDDLMKRIKAKIKAGASHTIEEPEEEIPEIQPSKVVDLLPLLRKSLEEKGNGHSHHTRKKAKGRHATSSRVHS
jgi:DNA end-binding protein Ku